MGPATGGVGPSRQQCLDIDGSDRSHGGRQRHMGLLRKGEGAVSPQNPRAAGRRSPPHTRHGWLMRSSFHTWLSHCPTRHRRLVPLPTADNGLPHSEPSNLPLRRRTLTPTSSSLRQAMTFRVSSQGRHEVAARPPPPPFSLAWGESEKGGEEEEREKWG